MTLNDAIKQAKSAAQRARCSMFIVRDPNECDDDSEGFHFGDQAACSTVFAHCNCVATVHPDTRVVYVEEQRVAA